MWRGSAVRAALALVVAAQSAAAWLRDDHVPVVVDGPWRFTAVTDRLIRIEYDTAKRFVDEPTLAFLRTPPLGLWVGRDSSRVDSGTVWSVLNTSGVSLRYRPDVPPGSGTVVLTSLAGRAFKWTWGDDPSAGNLLGTIRTLDGVTAGNLRCDSKDAKWHCAWGLVSRNGWAVVNDTGAPVWSEDWFAESRNSTDVSVFMHGLDYAAAIKDFFHASGPPGLPPRWALGTMFTRWFDFDSDSTMAMIDGFESRSLPLDAWIFDMNWHLYGPWGSFSWNHISFPRKDRMLSWIRERGLRVGANMHEHGGIETTEDTYDEFCKAVGCTPGQKIPFDLYNKTYAMAQEDIAVRALESTPEKQGIDFSWIDYQQGEADQFQQTRIRNLNPTIVLNMLRYTDKARHHENSRSLILARWGGLGTHRYPFGFSGDQHHSWSGLAFLPYFTSTAANVGYGYWSHDTVGGSGKLSGDHELSVRWVQTSAWSPVFRYHDKGEGTGKCATTESCARVVPWDVPTPFFEAIREATRERDALMPYIYTASCQTASTGLALVRPMYYEDPSDEDLYGLDRQYLFGPDLIVSPITDPSDDASTTGAEHALGAVGWSMYAPRSTTGWVDLLSGELYAGGANVSGVYGIRDVPALARQGAVVPRRPWARGDSSLGRAQRTLSAIEFRIMPAKAFYSGGSLSGSGVAIDDDGVSMDFAKGRQAVLKCEYHFHGRGFDVKVSSTGDYEGRPQRVTLVLAFLQLPPVTATAASPSDLQWSAHYHNALLGSTVLAHDVDLAAGVAVRVEIDAAYASSLPNFVGAYGRVRRARYIKDALDDLNVKYGHDRANLTSYALAATEMEPAFAAGLPALWKAVEEEVSKYKDLSDERRRKFIAAMLSNGVDLGARRPLAEPALEEETTVVV